MPTPNIDAIAANGAVFVNGYAGNATCAPSRAAIMTGRYATRFGFEFTPAPVAFHRLVGSFDYGPREAIFHDDRVAEAIPTDQQGLPPDEITMAEILRDSGYRTLFIGKWHLGAAEPFQPQNQGFDEWVGFYPGAALFLPPDHPDAVNLRQDFDPIDPFLWANLNYAVRWNGSQRFAPDGYMTDYFADQAVSAIQANRNRPFFLYLALNAPHTPLQALRSDVEALAHIEDERLRIYAAMIRAVDRPSAGCAKPWWKRGWRRTRSSSSPPTMAHRAISAFPISTRPTAAGRRPSSRAVSGCPCWWNGRRGVAPGTVIEAPAAHVDLFTTVARAAGADLPGDRTIDGIDLIDVATGGPAPERALFWRSGHYRVLLHEGWKLQVSEHPQRTWLFNLAEDPTEQTDLADAEPARLAAMKARLEALDAEQAEPIWPSLVAPPVFIDRHLLEPRTAEDDYVHWPN